MEAGFPESPLTVRLHPTGMMRSPPGRQTENGSRSESRDMSIWSRVRVACQRRSQTSLLPREVRVSCPIHMGSLSQLSVMMRTNYSLLTLKVPSRVRLPKTHSATTGMRGPAQRGEGNWTCACHGPSGFPSAGDRNKPHSRRIAPFRRIEI